MDRERGARQGAEAALELYRREHAYLNPNPIGNGDNDDDDDVYGRGIRPAFDARKAREFSSYWNWAMQDCLRLFHATLSHGVHVRDR